MISEVRLRRRRRHVGPYEAELMLQWLLVRTALGRSENTAPFWTRARWATSWLAMKIAGRDPIWRVTMGPYLARRFRRIGSISKNDFRSQRKLPMMGKVKGPGGRFLLDDAEEMIRLRRALMRAPMQREKTMMNQVSIALGFALSSESLLCLKRGKAKSRVGWPGRPGGMDEAWQQVRKRVMQENLKQWDKSPIDE
ncbi:hypothetical protein NMG60_11006197 [Bertholletia excelsa]